MRLSYLSFSAAILLGACAPMSQVPDISDDLAMREAELQREMVATEIYKNYDHLQKVAQPLLVANAPLCGEKIGAYEGVDFDSLDDTPRDYKNTMQRLFGLEKQPTVYHITENSPAFGKLKARDVVRQINGKDISSGTAGINQVNDILKDNKDVKPLAFAVERNGAPITVTVQPKLACNAHVLLQNNQLLNAYADGQNIFVTTGMMNFVNNDNELALVLGHELAHNSRLHVESQQGNAIIGTVLGAVVTGLTGVNVTGLGSDIGGTAFSQGFEAEADYVGLYHAARAGYDISDAAQIWRRMGTAQPEAIHLAGSSHPSTAKRFIALEMAVKEVQGKKAIGQNIAPQEKDPQEFKKEIGELNQ